MKISALVLTVAIIAAALVSFIIGAVAFSKTTVDNTRVIELEGQLLEAKGVISNLQNSAAKDVIVEKNVTVEVEKDYLGLAVSTFLEAVEDEEDEAGNDIGILGNYNMDEVSVKKVYDDYSVVKDGDKTSVNFDIKLRFKEEDKDSETKSYSVTVIYEEDEDTVVEYAEI